MGQFAVLVLVLAFLQLLSICTAKHQTFVECISSYSINNSQIQERVFSPNTTTYLSLLEFAVKNPRWFNLTRQRPYLIVAPIDIEEIRPVILCGKELGLQIRAKSGGHDYEGLSFRSESPFVMLDLSNLNTTSFNLEEETVWIQSGVTIGQLYYEIAQRSPIHAFPAGLYPSVGSGGHISGGGLGTIMRKYGLASDNVLDAVIMDVEGNVLDRREMGEDLFWAIRGGGGASFGVILGWKLKLVRVPEQVTAFTIRRKLDLNNMTLLQKWQQSAYNLSKDLFIRTLISNNKGTNPGDEKIVQVAYNGLFLGTAEELVPLLNQTFPEFGLQTADCLNNHSVASNCSDRPCIKKTCYQGPWIRSVLYNAGTDPNYILEVLLTTFKNQNYYQKSLSDFLKAPILDKGWEMIHKMLLSEDEPMLVIDPLGGMLDEIAEDETPYPHRKGNLFSVQYITTWIGDNSEAKARKHLRWIRRLYKKMEPYVANSPRTAYINYRDLGLGKNDGNYSYEGAKVWGEKYFKGNFERLARVKGKVDPGNFFRNEQSFPVLI